MDEPVVYLNDGFVPASQAHLKIYDLGIVLGATLTEMTRTFQHQPFRLEDHAARLLRSCKYAGIELELDHEGLVGVTRELIDTNSALIGAEEDLGAVHFVTPGENPIYAGSAGVAPRLTPTLCIHSFPLPFALWKANFNQGIHVVTPSIRHVPPQCVDPKTKNRSRLHYWLADKQSQAVDSKATSLLLDLDGNLTECSGANFVLVEKDTIYTPTSRNILEGVSLVTLRELAPALGLKWVAKDLQPYDAVNADEAWLTSTPYCLAPCTRINNTPIGDGRPGPLFARAMEAWSQRVGMDIMGQFTGAN
ncbi:MAG: branched-chain amino acid aminotransferase [Candidatus Latescibacteria bacterium]|nr:branched-chain amino acid aminotransferase [Candidatus Latescibacterota bacterium]